jgi:hypothetical protein
VGSEKGSEVERTMNYVNQTKDILGKRVTATLLKVVTEELPTIPDIQDYLKRGRQEAAKVFSYCEGER